MEIIYEIVHGLETEEVEKAKSQIKIYKKNQKAITEKIKEDLLEIGEKNDFDVAETLFVKITAYGNGIFIVYAIELGLFCKTKKIEEGFMRVFYELEKGSNDPTAVVDFYKEVKSGEQNAE